MSVMRTMTTLTRLALACTVAMLLTGCHPGVPFTTDLSATRGLRKGDPVTHDGDKIGAVDDIRSMPDGKSQVAFSVNQSRKESVRRDSIAELKTDNGPPHLEIVTPDANSPVAEPNAHIGGASTDAEAALMMGRGQLKGLAGGLADVLHSINENLEGIANSPAWDQFHKDLNDVQRQVDAAGEQGHEILSKQLPRLENEFKGLEDQLIKEGKTLQVERLRKEFDQLARGLAATPTPTAGY